MGVLGWSRRFSKPPATTDPVTLNFSQNKLERRSDGVILRSGNDAGTPTDEHYSRVFSKLMFYKNGGFIHLIVHFLVSYLFSPLTVVMLFLCSFMVTHLAKSRNHGFSLVFRLLLFWINDRCTCTSFGRNLPEHPTMILMSIFSSHHNFSTGTRILD